MLTEIDHIAIAVADLDAAIEYYERTFGVAVDHREVVVRDGVEEALLHHVVRRSLSMGSM